MATRDVRRVGSARVPVLGDLGDGRPTPDGPPARAAAPAPPSPHEDRVFDLLSSTLRDQTAATNAGFGRLEAAVTSQTRWGIGLAALALVLAAAYLGVGADVRVPGVGAISTAARAASDGTAPLEDTAVHEPAAFVIHEQPASVNVTAP